MTGERNAESLHARTLAHGHEHDGQRDGIARAPINDLVEEAVARIVIVGHVALKANSP